MKKKIINAICVIMILTLVACGGKKPAESSGEPAASTPAAEQEVAEEPQNAAEEIQNDKLQDEPEAAADESTDSAAVAEETEAEGGTNGTFTYIHDPRENPEAMKDIIENPDAVYGFSPDPESQRLGAYAEYDWTDPEFVAWAKEERRAYHESMDSMSDILYEMRDEGASIEEMARAVSEERNRLRMESYADDPEGLAVMKESNLKTYGREEGPTPDQLYEKYGSWTAVIQKAFSTNMGMDACCGLYDEYYWLYIELGYVE